jgi:tetratricopeptide (TPR) repeat protein
MARTLLMAGWAPFWRDDLDGARTMFEEALSIARSNEEGDPWAEARALTSLSSVISPVGDEEECLRLSQEALAIGREIKDRFTIGVAQMYSGNSLRRMFRLEEALPALDEAVRIFRDLGSRWELASAMGDRGTIHRLEGRFANAVEDLKASLKLCKELGDRSILSWTVGELVRTHLAAGDLVSARRVLEDPPSGTDAASDSMQVSKVLIELLSGERKGALTRAVRLLEKERGTAMRNFTAAQPGQINYVAARILWVGRLFGPEHAGGEEEVEQARTTLEEHHWIQFLREPDLQLPAAAATA